MLAPAVPVGHRLACALLHDPALAEDAVQEASVKAWRKVGHLHAGAPFQPWFLGIVARQCHDQMRSRWWHVVRKAEVAAPPSDAPDDTSIRSVLVRQALSALGDRDREVLILRLYLDLPWNEVAIAAHLTEAGARTRYYRALDRLRPLVRAAEVS